MKTVAEICDNGYPRLDIFVSNTAKVTRTHAQKLIDEGAVVVNGKTATKCSAEVKEGDEVVVTLPDDAPLDIPAENIPLHIVYEDNDLAVIDKPQGMIVHPTSSVFTGTLVNALLFGIDDLSGINGVLRPGIVHRLDKDTSGLIVIAKNDFAHVELQKQIQVKTCRRIYLALLEGTVKQDDGFVDKPIGRSKRDRKKMDVVEDGRPAQTYYRVLRRYRNYSFVRFELKTGRTHQIRVHAARVLAHPVVADPLYGHKDTKWGLKGQLLHAWKLSFVHPRTGQPMEFCAPLPDYFLSVISNLEPTAVTEATDDVRQILCGEIPREEN